MSIRRTLGLAVARALRANSTSLRQAFTAGHRCASFQIDDVAPAPLARSVFEAFPAPAAMRLLDSLRERKLVAAQMDRHAPILEEAVYAFQEPEVVQAVAEITGLAGLEPDAHLYAGGISQMLQGHFLNPHIDNSHDKDRARYRVLNLLWYVTPDYPADIGGNLELWDEGPRGPARTIHSRFNRLVVMATHKDSWHSVSPITAPAARCCVSNYYFSARPLEAEDYFHVTSYRGRPEQPLRDAALVADAKARSFLRLLFPKGVRENPHVYKRP